MTLPVRVLSGPLACQSVAGKYVVNLKAQLNHQNIISSSCYQLKLTSLLAASGVTVTVRVTGAVTLTPLDLVRDLPACNRDAQPT